MKLKYVVFDHTMPVVFGEYFQHSDVRGRGIPTSAGFCSIREIDTPENSANPCVRMLKVSCYGESISLKLKSSPEDERLIERMLNGYS